MTDKRSEKKANTMPNKNIQNKKFEFTAPVFSTKSRKRNKYEANTPYVKNKPTFLKHTLVNNTNLNP